VDLIEASMTSLGKATTGEKECIAMYRRHLGRNLVLQAILCCCFQLCTSVVYNLITQHHYIYENCVCYVHFVPTMLS